MAIPGLHHSVTSLEMVFWLFCSASEQQYYWACHRRFGCEPLFTSLRYCIWRL